jgi:hypothetical protein
MNYETVQALSSQEFKRYTGVYKQTFDFMLESWRLYNFNRSKAGRPPKLDLADQLLVALQYWREYRPYFHIAIDWSISEASVCRIVHRVETVLLNSGQFRLPGKSALLSETQRPEVVIIDVTETPIERPKVAQKQYYSGKKNNTPLNLKCS